MNNTTAVAPGRRRRIGLMIAAMSAALFATTTPGAAAAPQDQGQMVHLPGGDIHVVASGAPSADAVVLLHGLAGSTAWWDQVMPALQDRYVVRIDLLGHGESAKPDSGYSMEEQARRVGEVLDRLGVRHAVVVGHSTGGYVATSLAEQRRDLVSALELIDTGARLDAYTDSSPVSGLFFNPAIGQPLWPLLPDAAIRYLLSSAFTRNVPIPGQLVADVRGMTYRGLTATSNASDAYLRAETEPDRLVALHLPTMVIYGSEDKRFLPASYRDYSRVPGVRIVSLDCGHTPMIEDPGPTGVLIHDFVEHH
ncbi:pimeloyl-ACP methyl ester carboxylesterase [Nocardia sp. GAS34]|jgi:pimeloyl-ACP methyl ester carboxylesterase|uniref:alpha/beta fold hydrolase n=1 Tax=unclassified Nocardia TaxID=2637762 RepID=UPI003D24A823